MSETLTQSSDKVFYLAFKFLEQEPAAAARLLETAQPLDVAGFLANTPLPLVTKVIDEIFPQFSAQIILTEIATEKGLANLWLSELSDNSAAAILRCLSHSQQVRILNELHRKKRGACQTLLHYHADMVGAWVEVDVPIFAVDMAVEECIKRLKRRSHKENRIALVVDQQRQLIGEAVVAELLRTTPSDNVGTIATPIHSSLSGHLLLSSALSHPIWEQSDVAVVVDSQKAVIGVMRYSQLRQSLAQTSGSLLKPASTDGAVLDLLQAHGESMRALFDSVTEILR